MIWDLRPFDAVLERIDAVDAELDIPRATDGELRRRADALRSSVRGGAPVDDALPEAFALVREAARRTMGLRHYDVQMLGAIALHGEHFVQMHTGEGKTLVAVAPAFLGSLEGRGVLVLTFNDYLARRDAAWMRPVYELLGASVAHVEEGMTREERREAYAADVTYLTARELGYDYLRHGLLTDPADVVVRPFHRAIVDEADSILIDEARVPLVIAGATERGAGERRLEIARLVGELAPGEHFEIGDEGRTVFLTEAGAAKACERLGVEDLSTEANRDAATLVQQALHAHALLRRDVDYVIRGGRALIVDEFTGRVVRDRHWPDGLHRAVEAKEQLTIADQGRILNSVTTQHLFALFPHLCGMSGTLLPSEEELERFYGRRTVVLPPHRPCIRRDRGDLVFTHEEAKLDTVVAEIVAAHAARRPVLVGTSSVEESERLAARLGARGIPCSVLNAKNDAAEADVVAEAGAPGAVTVSTNMAGRGTDIRLGGRDERRRGEVVARGGLYVIGTTRFESRRVDDQLRGRAGRQGDPGESRFFVSLEDPLMRRFGVARWIPKRKRRERLPAPIDDPVIGDKIALTQRIVEGQNFDIRRTLWDYTSFVEGRRRRWYAQRDELLVSIAPRYLDELTPERRRELAAIATTDVLARVERRIALFHMDELWSEFLADIADLREGIHLQRLGGRDPLHEFGVIASRLFEESEAELRERIVDTLETAAIARDGLDPDDPSLKGPSSTWTYLVNDNPFEWLGGLTDIGNAGYGITAAIYFGWFFLARAAYRKLFRRPAGS